MKTMALSEPKPLKAFRDRYPAALMMVAALLISLFASAQDSTKYSRINGYGFGYKRFVLDSILMVPLSTSPHTPYRAGGIRYNQGDSTLQLWTGHQWNSIITGGTGIDTAYTYDDSTIAIQTPNQTFFVRINGQNLANASLTASDDYTQDWLNHWFFLNNLKALDLNSNRTDPNYPGNKKTFSFYSDSTAATYPLWLKWALRNTANNQDSLGGDLTFGKNYSQLNNYNGNAFASVYASGNQFFPSVQTFASDGSTQSVLTVGANTIFIDAHDSTRVKLVPSATAAGDSMVVSRNYGLGLNTLFKVPVPSGGSADSTTFATNYDVDTAKANLRIEIAGGGGSGTVTQVNTGYGLSGGPITTTGTAAADTLTLKAVYLPLTLNNAKTINQAGNNILFTGGGETKSDSFKLSTLIAPPVTLSLVALGHSIMYGQGASTNDSTLKYRNSHYYGLSLIDLSLSASGIWRAASNFYLNVDPGHSDFTTVMAGLNDVRRNGWAAMTHAKLINGYNAIFANQYLASWVPAGDASVDKSGGTWSVGYTSSTVGGKAVNQGMFSTTLDDYAEWTFSGTTVVVGLMGADGVGGSNYEYAQGEIYVDGVLKTSVNETGQWDGITDGVNDNKRGTYPIIITGLSSGSHTVRVKQKESGKYFVVDYFGTLVAPSVGKPLMIYHDPYLTSSGYAASPSNANDDILDSLNMLIDSLHTVYTGWGYPVYVAQTNNYYDPNTDGSGDGIHPGDVGYLHMFEAGKAAFATTFIPASPGSMYFTNNGKAYIGLPSGEVKAFAYDGDTSSYISNQTTNIQTGGFKINGTGTVGTIVAPTATLGNTTFAAATGTLMSFAPVAGQIMIGSGGTISGSMITTDHEISASGGLLWAQRNLSSASNAYSALALAVQGSGNATGGAQLSFRNDGAGREYVMGYDVSNQRFRITWGNQDQFNGRSFFSLDSLTGQMRIATPADGNSSDSLLVWRSSDSSVRKVVASTVASSSGTYTPTLTNESNVTSSTAYQCQYMRVGNVVTVSGKITVDYTSTGLASVGISLPIASSIANDYEIAGTANAEVNNGARIQGDPTNDRAQFYINTGSSAGYDYFFTFTYLVQ